MEENKLEYITKDEFNFYNHVQKKENELEGLYTKMRGKICMMMLYASVSIGSGMGYQSLGCEGETAQFLQTICLITGIVTILKMGGIHLRGKKIDKTRRALQKLKSKREYKSLEEKLKEGNNKTEESQKTEDKSIRNLTKKTINFHKEVYE